MGNRKLKAVLGALVLALLAAIYGRLIVLDPRLARDDVDLISPLETVHTVADYFQLRQGGRVADVQPLRDLSLWLDLQLSGGLGFGTFHLTNCLIWLVILLLAQALFVQLGASGDVALAVTAVLAVHPLFVGSVGWSAARKHLLACAFILAATLATVKMAKAKVRAGAQAGAQAGVVVRALGISLLYTAALLSQPIFILWPFWAFLHLQVNRARRLSWLIPALAAPPMLVLGAVNYQYYADGAYAARMHVPKFVSVDASRQAITALLALGRDVANVFWPAQLVTEYFVGAALNLVGLLAAPALLFIAYKRLKRPLFLSLAAFTFLPLVPVTGRMTNVFVSDTYLLVPAIGIACMLLACCQGQAPLRPGAAMAARLGVVTLFALLAVLARRQANTWESDERLWAWAYRVEPTPGAMARYGGVLLNRGATLPAVAIALQLKARAPGHPAWAPLLAQAVCSDPDPELGAKLIALTGGEGDHPAIDRCLARLGYRTGRRDLSAEILMRAVSRWPGYFVKEREVVAAELSRACADQGSLPAGDAAALSCQHGVDVLKGLPGAERPWDEDAYRGALALPK